MKLLSSAIHIVQGAVGGRALAQTFPVLDRLFVNCDDVTCGPAIWNGSLEDWAQCREDFWTNLHSKKSQPIPNYWSPNKLFDPARLGDEKAVVFWVGTGVADQFTIPYVLKIIESLNGTPVVHVIQFREHENGNAVIKLGHVPSKELISHPEPVQLSDHDISQYLQIWDAFTSHKPHAFVDYCDNGHAPSIEILMAMRAMLRRYPEKTTGICYWDKVLLDAVHLRGPRVAEVLAHVYCQNSEVEIDTVGDLYLFWRLQQLGREGHECPLVELKGDSISEAMVKLTAFGNEVVYEKVPAFPKYPIDEWIGGVHLQSPPSAGMFFDGDTVVGM